VNEYLDTVTSRKPPRAPRGFVKGGRGRALWAAVLSEWALRPDERRILEDVCREADLIDRMQTTVDAEELVVVGGRGAKAPHPLLRELDRHRGRLQQLLDGLGLEEVSGTAGSDAGRRLAGNRWRRRKG